MSIRAGFLGVIGQPNSGKSTLVNLIIGEKVSIVSPKPQTTRKRAIGLFTDDECQIAFVDSPGFVKASNKLNEFIGNEYEEIINGSDALIFLHSISDSENKLEVLIEYAKKTKKPFLFLLNKCDLKSAKKDIALKRLYDEKVNFYEISSQNGQKYIQEKLVPLMKKMLPLTEKLMFEDEIYTTQTVREMCAEYIREKCFSNLYHEIPYGLAIKIIKFDENGKIPKIYAEIYVNKESHKSMVVGKSGSTIKIIGTQARIEIEKLMNQKIYLNLQVKVKKSWINNQNQLKEFGYGI